MTLSPELMRAARLSGLPGVTLDAACERFGVTKGALQGARKQLGESWLRPSREDLVLAILTEYAAETDGALPDLVTIASYVDFVEKDGCTPAEVRVVLERLEAQNFIEMSDERWQLVEPWPFVSPGA